MLNYNKLIMKKKEPDEAQMNKQVIVQESIDAIGKSFPELIFKHDGCRIVQALIKHGSKAQKEFVVDQIKPHIV
jgi:hypothetical protein